MLPMACILAFAHSNSADTAKLQFWACVGAVVGVVLFIRGFIMLREKRIVLNTPASKIRSAAMGLVEVSGAAKGPQTIPAGITGDACYYYRAIAWQMRQSGKNESWKKVADESLYVPFFVDDATGKLLVDPQQAELDVHRNFNDEIGSSFLAGRGMMTPSVSQFVLRNSLNLSQRTRLEEYCIKPDYPLFVLGTLAQTSGNPEWTATPHAPASRVSLSSRVSFLGPGGTWALQSIGFLPALRVESAGVVAASAGDGANLPANVASGPAPKAAAKTSWSSVTMDEKAMAALNSHTTARSSAAPAAAPPSMAPVVVSTSVATAEPDTSAGPAYNGDPQPAAALEFDLRPPTFLGKGANGDPFIISCRSQRELVQSMAWKSTLCIWGGPILTLGCLYFLALTLGWT